MKFIPLDAVLAEIEKLQLCTMDEHMNYYSAEAQGEYNALSKLESFLDTLEVKEVDLDEEADNYWETLTSDVRDSFYFNDFYKIAKHFFELGLKAQKGEKGMTDNLQKRIPMLIEMVRQVKSAVAKTSIECRPDRYMADRKEWYKPFEDVQQALDYAEYQIKTKLIENK